MERDGRGGGEKASRVGTGSRGQNERKGDKEDTHKVPKTLSGLKRLPGPLGVGMTDTRGNRRKQGRESRTTRVFNPASLPSNSVYACLGQEDGMSNSTRERVCTVWDPTSSIGAEGQGRREQDRELVDIVVVGKSRGFE